MTDILRIIFFGIIVRPILSFLIGLRVIGLENFPQRHPFIIIANHASHLDAMVVLNLFPLKDLKLIRPVAAADYFNRNKMISFLSKLFFNILPIERKHITRDRNPLDHLREALTRGESLIVFPEGTRTTCGEIGPFHTGIAHIIKEFPKIPVIPVYMSNMGRALPKGELILVPFIGEAKVGAPLYPSGSKEEIMLILREEVIHLKGDSRW